MGMISPNALFEASCQHMLEGRKPASDGDWGLLVNFWAANVQPDCASAICRLMKTLYECPLSHTDIEQIAAFQVAAKGRG